MHAINGPEINDAIAAIHLTEKIRRFHSHPASSLATLGKTNQAHRPGLTRSTSHRALDWALDVERTIQRELSEADQDMLCIMLVHGVTRDTLARQMRISPQRVSQLLGRAATRATAALIHAELIRSSTAAFNEHIAQPIRKPAPKRCRGQRPHPRQRTAPRIRASADPRRYNQRHA
jgi:predicted DNA-binding protein (UPF0251 family)